MSWLLTAAQLVFCVFTVVVLIDFVKRKTLGRFVAFIIFAAGAAFSYRLDHWLPLLAAFILPLIADKTLEIFSTSKLSVGWWRSSSNDQRRATVRKWFANCVAAVVIFLPLYSIALFIRDYEEQRGELNPFVKGWGLLIVFFLLVSFGKWVADHIHPPSAKQD